MTGALKQKTLVLLGLMILITMILAASLPRLELQPGMPLPQLESGQVVAVPAEGDELVFVSVNTFIVVLIALVLAGALLYSTYKLLTMANWNFIAGVLRSLLVICMSLAGFIFLMLLLADTDHSPTPVPIPVITPKPVVTAPLGAVPAPLLWLVGIALAVISLLVGMWIFRSSRLVSPIDLVAWEAEKARQALISGAGLKDVIIHCYTQMSLAVKQERGIEREDFMTTGEFERVLGAAGFPREPIHQLTRLFDAVRYGNWQSNASEEQSAIQCLEAIVQSSPDTKGRK